MPYIHTYIHTYIHKYIHKYIHVYIHAYTHTYTHTHTHTQNHTDIQGVPLATEPGISLIILTPTKFEQQYVLFFHISYTMR